MPTPIKTPITVGRLTSPAQHLTILPGQLTAEDHQEMLAALFNRDGYVILQTEHGPWQFLITRSSESGFTLTNHGGPGAA